MNTQRITTDIKNVGFTILHIQRSLSELQQFKDKMKSYLCEPNTVQLFETKELLQDRINGHIAIHENELRKLEHRKNILKGELNRIQEQLEASKELEKGISSYMLALHP
jgi:chromosome segregation ATPase